jgi:hypothetical protein
VVHPHRRPGVLDEGGPYEAGAHARYPPLAFGLARRALPGDEPHEPGDLLRAREAREVFPEFENDSVSPCTSRLLRARLRASTQAFLSALLLGQGAVSRRPYAPLVRPQLGQEPAVYVEAHPS